MISDYQQKGIYYEEENFSSCIRLDIVLRNDRMCVIGRAVTDMKSDVNGGMQRTITVYTADGK